jgi:calcineurin-like phosphoesterase family protein
MLEYEPERRPYASVEEMNKSIICAWNDLVHPDGIVWHLGDFTFARRREAENLLNVLNGRVHLIRGNHDREIKGGLALRFASVQDYKEVKAPDGTAIVLSHYPFLTWNKAHYGSWHLHGHCHGHLNDPGLARRMDVGVDTNQMKPYSYEKVARLMAQRAYAQVDQHQEVIDEPRVRNDQA